MRFFSQLFAPSLLRALVGRTVAVAVGALVVLAAVALYESNDLIAKQFEDEATIVAQAAANGIEGQSALLVRQASLLAPSLLEPGTPRETPGSSRVNCTKSLPFSGSSFICDSFTVAPSSELSACTRATDART